MPVSSAAVCFSRVSEFTCVSRRRASAVPWGLVGKYERTRVGVKSQSTKTIRSERPEIPPRSEKQGFH